MIQFICLLCTINGNSIISLMNKPKQKIICCRLNLCDQQWTSLSNERAFSFVFSFIFAIQKPLQWKSKYLCSASFWRMYWFLCGCVYDAVYFWFWNQLDALFKNNLCLICLYFSYENHYIDAKVNSGSVK